MTADRTPDPAAPQQGEQLVGVGMHTVIFDGSDWACVCNRFRSVDLLEARAHAGMTRTFADRIPEPADPLAAEPKTHTGRQLAKALAADYERALLPDWPDPRGLILAIEQEARAAARVEGPAVDVELLLKASAAVWPSHIEGSFSSPPSGNDQTWAVMDPAAWTYDFIAAIAAEYNRLRAATFPAAPSGGEAAQNRVSELEALITAAGLACPVCGGDGWTQETEEGLHGEPIPVQRPCWDAEHSVLLAAAVPAPSDGGVGE